MTNILFEISNKLNKFSRSEQKIGRYILAHVTEVTKMSTAELATASGVSTATVTRFGKLIVPDGGYPELKMKLALEKNIDKTLYDEINPKDSIESIKDKLALRINHTIEATNALLKEDILSQASHYIFEKKSIYVYGLGASDVAARDFTQKFMRIGKSIIHSQDTHLLAAGLTTQSEDAGLVLFSNSGEKLESIKLAEVARSLKIPVISVSSNRYSTLGKLSDVVVVNDDSEENQTARSAATTSLMAQLYVVDMLYYTFITNDYQRNIKQLVESQKTIKKHFS
ncbi:MurR/RpiR family transcriptional regulator [Ligilactobacillus sp. WILCCON 0076]|uniref:MurR/RpiR family transcriptional regulator n=1 Tax=Ligilactobacillus ubinensis TaxID=2876789 RepID=A0A9X2FKX0_9LACO|nr:MurR/RpiR family transcriptional regulator [Ligilactobacillus ubinensis]MCP0887094.1 MurR/RpiR family transcriptional regulator [Ligilactobacillus ubinensis]